MFCSHYLFLHVFETPNIVLSIRHKKNDINKKEFQSTELYTVLFHVTYVTLPQVQMHFQDIYALSTPNTACCFSKKVLWSLLQKCARFTIQIHPKFGFVLVNSFFIHPHKKDLLSTRSGSCGPLYWTLSTEPSAKMRRLSKCNFPTLLGNEYHPLCFRVDTAVEIQLSYQHALGDSFCP